ncbi:MAG: T9SS type A sorting domain-containing protein [Ignavibacteriaceae bacterium]|nr:T9SS type A sorting domain-containing protein [Ignavibacteriaceae bacterium]
MRILIISLLLTSYCFPQDYWKLFNKENSPLPSDAVSSVVQDKNGIYWISTIPEIINGEPVGGGIAKYNGTEWQIFTQNNSPLPTNRISWITVDSLNRKWIGTYEEGLICYDEGQWKIFNSTNSGLHSNDIYHLAISNDTVVWIATYNNGIAKFDGETWQIFRQTDFNLGSEIINFVYPINDTIWAGVDFGGLIYYSNGIWKHFGTGNYTPNFNLSVMSLVKDNFGYFWSNAHKANVGGLLVKFSDENIIFYDSTETGYNSKYSYNSIAVDDSNYKWIGTRDGLLSYNNSLWLKYNSPYSFNGFSFIYIDKNNNKITSGFNNSNKKMGLLFFNENDVTLSISTEINYNFDFALLQNYPNPFNPVTTITYQIPKEGLVTLKIYDILGKEVTTLINEQKQAGKYSIEFDASKLSSGVYLYELRSNEYKSTKKLLVIK